MQGITTQDGKQALAGLNQAKFNELQRNLNATGKKFDLEQLTRQEVATLRLEEAARNEEAAEMFENYFATMLVKEMRNSLSTGFFEGPGADAYGAWFDEHLGSALKQGDGLGVGKMIKTALAPADSRASQAPQSDLDGYKRLRPVMEFQELKAQAEFKALKSETEGGLIR